MKIEKLSDIQIRCTLSREDLERRNMRLSELAYGTENAQILFREMMRFAYTKYGFEADDSPLMIEAIPISSDAIVLLITKVEYPEELDTRFAKFSDFDEWDYDDDEDFFDFGEYFEQPEELSYAKSESANDIIESFAGQNISQDNIVITRLFQFDSLEPVFALSRVLEDRYQGDNTLLRNGDGAYFLVLKNGVHTPSEFNKICNIATEYGSQQPLSEGQLSFLDEHCKTIVQGTALQTFATL